MDTKGPEVRTTICQEPIPFTTGERVKIIGDPNGETTHDCIYVSYKNFVGDLIVGSDVLIDDGDLELKVIEKHDDHLVCEVQNDAVLGSRKSVNVPERPRFHRPLFCKKQTGCIGYPTDPRRT